MKRKIRRCVFETNSSSMHTLSIVPKRLYRTWKDSDAFLYISDRDSCWSSSADKDFKKSGKLYFFDDLEEWIRSKEEYKDMELDLVRIMRFLGEEGFVTYKDFAYGGYLEFYEDEYTTESGDEIVVFGEYGFDG